MLVRAVTLEAPSGLERYDFQPEVPGGSRHLLVVVSLVLPLNGPNLLVIISAGLQTLAAIGDRQRFLYLDLSWLQPADGRLRPTQHPHGYGVHFFTAHDLDDFVAVAEFHRIRVDLRQLVCAAGKREAGFC